MFILSRQVQLLIIRKEHPKETNLSGFPDFFVKITIRTTLNKFRNQLLESQ